MKYVHVNQVSGTAQSFSLLIAFTSHLVVFSKKSTNLKWFLFGFKDFTFTVIHDKGYYVYRVLSCFLKVTGCKFCYALVYLCVFV